MAKRRPKKTRGKTQSDGEGKEKRPQGRPTLYNESVHARIMTLAEAGKTDKQMAEAIGISERAFYYWKTRNEGFVQALKNAKDIPDDMVETALFSRAIGYNREIKKEAISFGKKVTWTETMHLPPDVVACIFWLKNRRPQQWRDKPEGPDPNAGRDASEVVIEWDDET